MILYARYKKGQKKSAMRALARSGLFSYIVPQKYVTLKLRTRERIRRSGVAKIRSMGEGPEEEAPPHQGYRGVYRRGGSIHPGDPRVCRHSTLTRPNEQDVRGAVSV